MAGIFEKLVDRFFKSNYNVCAGIDSTIEGLENKIRVLDSIDSYDNAQKSYVFGQMRTVVAETESHLISIKHMVDRELNQGRRAEFQPKYEMIQALIEEIKKRIERFERENFDSKILLVS